MKKDIILKEKPSNLQFETRLPPGTEETEIELTSIPFCPFRKFKPTRDSFGKKIPHKSMLATLPIKERKKTYGYIVSHLDHKHKSKEEVLICEWLQFKYGAENVQPNYKLPNLFRSIEIDFAVLREGKVDFFVEYHPNKGLPKDKDYEKIRKSQIKALYGDVPVVVMYKLPKILGQEYYK